MYSSELEELFGLEKNPDLELAQLKYTLTLPENKTNEELTSKVKDAVTKNAMGPWYALLCKDLEWEIDEVFYDSLKEKNRLAIETIDASVEDAEQNLGEMEVREAYLKKAEYYSIIGDKDNAVISLNKVYEKTMSPGQRLDIIFHLIRIGLFFLDYQLINSNIERAQRLVDNGGDWDRRNRLRVYRGAYSIAIRDFKTACELFLDAATTFTSYELMDFNTFGRYTIYLCAIALPRQQLKENVFKGSGISEVLHHNTDLKDYLNSLYTCHYADFFQHLASVEKKLREDYLFYPHYHHYVREMKIIAYNQVLESYRSLSLKHMSEQFGMSIAYIDEELSRFISTGRLHCKIDRVGGIVETNRFNNKNTQFQMVVKQGDLLLTRVQKLSRVINI